MERDERLQRLAEQAAMDQARRRACVYLDCAIENMVSLVDVPATIAMLEAHLSELKEFG